MNVQTCLMLLGEIEATLRELDFMVATADKTRRRCNRVNIVFVFVIHPQHTAKQKTVV